MVFFYRRKEQLSFNAMKETKQVLSYILEDVSTNNEYEYENDFKPYSYSKSFSQLSMLAMTPSSSL